MHETPLFDGASDGAVDGSPSAPDAARALLGALETLLARFTQAAERDPEVARACRVVGRWLHEQGSRQEAETAPAEARPPAPPEPAPEPAPATSAGEARPAPAPSRIVAWPELGSGPGILHHAPHPAPAPRRAPEHAPVTTVAARARLKADCCRWAIERRKRLRDGADFELLVKPRDLALGADTRALPDCYAWPLDPYVSLPEDRALDDAAGCYEALADAFELAERVRREEELFEAAGERAYKLLAECCSALRRVLDDCGVAKDADQSAAFDWLRTRVFDDRIYVARHMRLDDPADPSAWVERRERCAEVLKSAEAVLARAKELRNLAGKLGYIAKRWPDFAPEEARSQAERFAATVEALVQLGVRPSDARIRDPLLAIADDLPEDLDPRGPFAEALRFADEHAARREAEPHGSPPSRERTTTEVERARELLGGKVAVLIGGTCRPRSRDALREGLGLAELRWITTRDHEPVRNFEAQAVRQDVDLVLLAIRWASHGFEELKPACLKAGKPYVRLPRGYGLNQVAREIVGQASAALGGRDAK